MAYLGSLEWDYFDNEKEAKAWAVSLQLKGYDDVKYKGEKNGKYIVQKVNKLDTNGRF